MQQILIFLMFVAVFGLIAGMLLLTLALLSPKNAKPVAYGRHYLGMSAICSEVAVL